jgi:hypothetical protein
LRWVVVAAAVTVILMSAVSLLIFFTAALPSIRDVEAETGWQHPNMFLTWLLMGVKEVLVIVVSAAAIYLAIVR